MLTASSEHQASFFDVEFLCESLIPPDSYYRKFRELVWPLLTDEDFAALYCQDNGRPPIAPRLLAMALLLQFHRDLSDREMERTCMYDLEVKYALGLRLDERPFDHSSLGDFRQRLLSHGKEKLLFETILQTLVEQQLITTDEIQRIDATHIVADVAIPSMVQLVKMNRTKICWQITKGVLVELNVELEAVVAERDAVDELPEYPVFLLLGKLHFRKSERKNCVDKPFRRIVWRAVQRSQRLADSSDIVLQRLD